MSDSAEFDPEEWPWWRLPPNCPGAERTWADSRRWHERAFTPAEATKWAEAGHSPVRAKQLRDLGATNPEAGAMVEWRARGFTYEEKRLREAAGFTAEEATAWRPGGRIPEEARVARAERDREHLQSD